MHASGEHRRDSAAPTSVKLSGRPATHGAEHAREDAAKVVVAVALTSCSRLCHGVVRLQFFAVAAVGLLVGREGRNCEQLASARNPVGECRRFV